MFRICTRAGALPCDRGHQLRQQMPALGPSARRPPLRSAKRLTGISCFGFDRTPVGWQAADRSAHWLRSLALAPSGAESIRPFGTGGLGTIRLPKIRNNQFYDKALSPCRLTTLSNLSEGPPGCLSPTSHFCMVETLVLSSFANTGWLI